MWRIIFLDYSGLFVPEHFKVYRCDIQWRIIFRDYSRLFVPEHFKVYRCDILVYNLGERSVSNYFNLFFRLETHYGLLLCAPLR